MEPGKPAKPDLVAAENALFEGRLSGMVLTFRTNERPLQGLAGLLDWRFQGAISNCLRAGAITGKEGECAYIPVSRHGKVYHLVLTGVGAASRSRPATLPAASVEALRKNLKSLKIERIGVSRADFGNVDEQYFLKEFKGIELNVLP